jgi:hypothetical protein
LDDLPPVESRGIQVTTPHLYEYSPETNNSIIVDYANSLELKKYITTHPLSTTDVTRLGTTLGQWLKSFHAWGNQHASLPKIMKENVKMAQLKFAINYGRTVNTIPMFPKLLEGSRDMFEQMEAKYRGELANGEGNLIHGDFWSGKYVPSSSCHLQCWDSWPSKYLNMDVHN